MTTTPRELTLGGRILAIQQGDITVFPVDAMVNAANEQLAGGGGVDGAIHRAGGPRVMRDLLDRYGPDRRCPTGSAVVSEAGNLPARWVIHAVGPRWRGGDRDEPRLLRSAYTSALEIASELGARTISLPALSCGIYGYPLDDGARIGLEAVRDHLLGEASTIERATFVLFSDETFAVFDARLAALAGEGSTAGRGPVRPG